MVYMNDIVSRFKLIKFLKRKCNFTATCLVAAEIVFMETVEYLMVGEYTHTECMVHKTFVQSAVHRFEFYLVSPLLEYILQSVSLFGAVGTYIYLISTLDKIIQRRRHHIEILMENRLNRSLENEFRLWRSNRFGAEIHSSEIKSLVCEISSLNYGFLNVRQFHITFLGHSYRLR